MSMDWNEIRKEYETSDITMKELADKYGVKATTLRSRKNREGWQRSEKEKVATQRNVAKSVATQKAIEALNENDELTDKQKQFCLLYLQYFSATKAYQEAYGVDYRTAHANSYRVMALDGVQKELKRMKEAQRKELYVDSLDIKNEWLKQAFADITDFVEFKRVFVKYEKDKNGDPKLDENGEMIPVYYNELNFKNSDQVDGSLIQEVKQGRDGVSVKLYDKQKALQELMKLLGDGEGDGKNIQIINPWGVPYEPSTD